MNNLNNPNKIIMPNLDHDDHGAIESLHNARRYSKTSIGIFAGAALGYFWGWWIIGLLLGGVLGAVADATPNNVQLDPSIPNQQDLC